MSLGPQSYLLWFRVQEQSSTSVSLQGGKLSRVSGFGSKRVRVHFVIIFPGDACQSLRDGRDCVCVRSVLSFQASSFPISWLLLPVSVRQGRRRGQLWERGLLRLPWSLCQSHRN